MKGLELSRRYFDTLVKPAFQSEFPDVYPCLAFGLVGPGSECYGWDDEISMDHDWGPKVSIWVSDELFQTRGEALQKLYSSLPGECCGYGPVHRVDTGAPRDGVISITRFYETFLGIGHAPRDLLEWMQVTEENLSLCTNGSVFYDGPGQFSAIREELAAYYPKDVWYKKIASHCVFLSQHGQYNVGRAWKRGDHLSAAYNLTMFIHEAASLSLLLERRYRPFYKWQFKALRESGAFGRNAAQALEELCRAEGNDEKSRVIEACASLLAVKIKQTLGGVQGRKLPAGYRFSCSGNDRRQFSQGTYRVCAMTTVKEVQEK
ncbi:MAG: DUF4037 domain-containing protein [Spirochaetia bacterium]|nr:DUF4037 domain-containing protein [Spirochaetia bacterium]